MHRIVIVGTAGSGKSHLGATLGAQLRFPVVELDALFWQENWTQLELSHFRASVDAATQTDCWIVVGNYTKVRDLVWPRADTLIWLDYPFPLVFSRLLRRTLQRIVRQEELWANNRESWRAQFASRDSLLLFAIRTRHRLRRQIPALLAEPAYRHLKLVHLPDPAATAAWLATLA